jgi:hypothetical protein
MEIFMHSNKKELSIALMLSVTAALFGCGDSIDDLDDALTHDAKISFVNSLDYMTDFHIKKRNIASGYSGLFDNDNVKSRDVPTNSVGDTYSYRYKAINNMVNLGIRDSINLDKEERTNITLSDKDDLWAIAWENSGERSISVVDKKQNNKANVFNVRLFTYGNYDVSLANSKILTTEKGKVTNYLEVSNCADDLNVAGNTIDLCSGDLGKSYLLILDSNGKRVMAEE